MTEAHRFHGSQAGQYIFPRSPGDFYDFVSQQRLFIARRSGETEVIGLCYMSTRDPKKWEFGGMCVEPGLQGYGVGAALARASIATAYLMDDTPKELIAHVHEDNNDPRNVLVRLGFVDTGTKEFIDGAQMPASMKRNEKNQVVGDIFDFNAPTGLEGFVKWYENFNGTIKGSRGSLNATLELPIWYHRKQLLPALREVAEALKP